jgi:hypothetical protein
MMGTAQVLDLRRSRGIIIPRKLADYLELEIHDQLFLQALDGVLYVKKLEVITRGRREEEPKIEDLEKQKGLKNDVQNWESGLKAESGDKNRAQALED